MSFRTGERRDGSSYKYPVTEPNSEYKGVPLEVHKIQSSEVPMIGQPKGFIVHMIFKDDRTDEITEESVPIIVGSYTGTSAYTEALDRAFEEKHNEDVPILVNIIDPSLEEVISMAMERAKKGAYKIKDIAVAAGERAPEIAQRAVDVIRGPDVVPLDDEEEAYLTAAHRDQYGRRVASEPTGVWRGVDIAAKTARGLGRVASLAGQIGYEAARYWAMAPEERRLEMLEKYRQEGRISPKQYREYAGPLIERLSRRKSRSERLLESVEHRLDEAQVKFWIQDAYSSDPETRRYARMKIREKAPEVYGVMDFGRSIIGERGLSYPSSTTGYVPVTPVFQPKGGRAWQFVYDPRTGRYLRVQEERTAMGMYPVPQQLERRVTEEEIGHRSPIGDEKNVEKDYN